MNDCPILIMMIKIRCRIWRSVFNSFEKKNTKCNIVVEISLSLSGLKLHLITNQRLTFFFIL